jgi:hypothetical protein
MPNLTNEQVQFKDLLKNANMDDESPWPELFLTGALGEYVETAKTDYLAARLKCCADVYMAWGLCKSGMYRIPAMFGEGMVRAQTFLGVKSVLPEDLTEISDAWLAEYKAR